MAAAPIYPGVPKNGVVQIVPADTTALKTLYTAGASGAKITAFTLCTDETAARDIQVWLTIGGTDYLLGTVTVPIGAGSSGAVMPVNVLTVLSGIVDPTGALLLQASAILKVRSLTTLTAAKTMHAVAEGADF